MNTFCMHSLVYLLFGVILWRGGNAQRCAASCRPPECSCSRFVHPMETKQIPQMIYFGFDDAVNSVMSSLYDRLFTGKVLNPNGCPIKMTLFVSHQYTDYRRVKGFHARGMEIGVHSVTHTSIDNDDILYKEAKQQKDNLIKLAGVPATEIIGWRSPFLKTAGTNQPKILHELGYEYDISLTYTTQSYETPKPWPFTLEHGWPYRCGIPPCPIQAHEPNFWAVPVVSLMDHKGKYACAFVDGCAIPTNNEQEAFDYLWKNFETYYNGSRAPFGLNMHAAWFYRRYQLKAMMRFLDELSRLDDVWVLTVKQVLDWMKHPTTLSDIDNMQSWGCQTERPANNTIRRTGPTTKPPIKRRIPARRQELIKPQRFVSIPERMVSWFHPTIPRTSAFRGFRPGSTKQTRVTTTSATTSTTNITPTTLPETTSTTARVTAARATTPRGDRTHYKRPLTTRITNKTSTTKTLPIDSTTHVPSKHTTTAAPAVAPFFKTWFTRRPTTTALPSSPGNWWQHTGSSQEPVASTCVQGDNCLLPDCYCETTAIPGGLQHADTPQLVYITIDGSMNPIVYRRYRQLFRTLRNPNNCRARGTVFSTGKGTYSFFLRLIVALGAEVAMRGINDRHFTNVDQMESEITQQKRQLKRLGIDVVRGWKTPEMQALGDEQYRLLSKYDFEYDATLSINLPKPGKAKQWPFTLDYGFTGDCIIPDCPSRTYPGLWEVPVMAVRDYRHMFECGYVDGCMFNPPTRNDTFTFLWDNFVANYESNKAPFGIHLRTVWFSHPAYLKNIRGLIDFLRRLRQLTDVYLVSVSDVIQWMKTPTKLSEISASIPWDCDK